MKKRPRPEQPDSPRPPRVLPRRPDPWKADLASGPRPLTLKMRGELDIEDYIPDDDGNARRYA